MDRSRFVPIAFVVASSLAMLLLSSSAATAQTVKVEGLIVGRSGDSMTLQTSDSPKLVVELTDDTEVAQVEGVFKARRKKMSMAALIPGLKVKVEGNHGAENQLVASKVTFKGDDLEAAQAIQAGTQPSNSQIQQTQQQLEEQRAALAQQQQEMSAAHAANTAAIEANKSAIEQTNKRFGQLDDYNILGEVVVYFGNGEVALDPSYKSQLLQLADKAKGVNGYLIQVKGYASSVGSAALNQQLSEDRADNVTEFLQQEGHVPLTRMLAPAAMGESRQVGNDQTEKGQAENRRVVVRVLQNKGITGT
jgi:outer membrane protein OmpA-like peptidoglycan-associated protein